MHPASPTMSAVHLLAVGGPPPRPLELLITYLPMAMIVLVAWMMLYRPERQRMRQHQELLTSLKKNDRVLTSSGIYGTVANVDHDADRVLLRVDEAGNVKIAVTLSSIAKVLTDKLTDKGEKSSEYGGGEAGGAA
ncbi:MAG: preprotein translocase subunit YajC [Planctomycetota bacterium]